MFVRVLMMAACLMMLGLAAFVWRLAYKFRPRSERDLAMRMNLWLFFVACIAAAALMCWRAYE